MRPGGLVLSRLGSERRYARIERAEVGAEALHTERRGDVSEFEGKLCVMEGERRQAGRPARAVADRESVLGPKLDRREARAFECLVCGQPRAIDVHLALADERETQVREQVEVTWRRSIRSKASPGAGQC